MVTEQNILNISVRAHIAGIVTSIAVFIAVLPYTYVGDCRANVPSREIVELVWTTINLFWTGIVLAVLPHILFCVEKALYLIGVAFRRPALAAWSHVDQQLIMAFPGVVATTTISLWSRFSTSFAGRVILAFLREFAPLVVPFYRWGASRVIPFAEWCVEGIEWGIAHRVGVCAAASFAIFLYSCGLLFSETVPVLSLKSLVDQQEHATEVCASAQGWKAEPKRENPWVNVTPYQPAEEGKVSSSRGPLQLPKK